MSIKSVSDLLETAVGFQKSQTLFTLLELEIPKILANESFKAADIARQTKIHPLAMERFLNACVSIGILRKEKDSYSNTEFSGKYLLKDGEFYLGGQMNRYRNRSLPQWTDLTGHLRNWKYGAQNKENPAAEDQGAEAMAEQHNLALLHGHALAKNFDFSKYKNILDLGGGTGATSIGLCENYPLLASTVFDLPENIKVAEEFIEKANLKERIEVTGGDFQKGELPPSFDVVILANFMAVTDAETNKNLLGKLYEKLPSGGVCLLSGWMLDDSLLAPQISVLFCLEDICWNAPDVERSEKVYAGWLLNAGFKDIKCKTYLKPTKMLYGFKHD